MDPETHRSVDRNRARVRAAIAQLEKAGGKVTRRRVQSIARMDMRTVVAAMKAIESEMDPGLSFAPEVSKLTDKFASDLNMLTSAAFKGRLAAAESERDEALAHAADAESSRQALDEKQTAVLAGHLHAFESVQTEKIVLANRVSRADAHLDDARRTELELRGAIERLTGELSTAREEAARAKGMLEVLQATPAKSTRRKAS